MRRSLFSLIVLALCLIGGGCGSAGSPSSSTVSSPLATELSYFPPGGPFVASIATNPHGSAVQGAQGLLGAFPLSKVGISLLVSQLTSGGVNYQSDIEPLFGNPIAFGVPQVPGAVSVSGSNFLAVWITKSASKLDSLIKKVPSLTPSGTVDGATVYRAGASTTIAVDGATVVVGASTAGVEAALNRHAHGGGITAADFSSAMGNLAQNALIEAFGNLTGALSSPQTATARNVPWIAAIRSYAASISAASTGLTAQFRINTAGGSLSSAALPIAAGTATPSLAGTLPIVVGVHDPAQTVNFILAALQASGTKTYARFAKGESALKRKTGYDLSTFAALLTGNLIVESDAKTTMGRAEVSDPASAAKQLALLPQLESSIHGAAGVTPMPGGFYAIKSSKKHGRSVNLGLVGNQLVAGAAPPAQLRAFAAAPTTAATTQGAVAFRINLLGLLGMTSGKSSTGAIIRSALSSLGDITGSASATTDAVAGSLTLRVR